MRQIAAKAGVSPATVSRALHSPHLVKDSTLARIRQVMSDNRYVYNKAASDLTTKRGMTLGLIVPTIANSIHAGLIHGIQAAAQEEHYSTIIGNTDYAIETELDLLRVFVERRVTGIIQAGILPQKAYELMETARDYGIPTVLVWECSRHPHISSVGVDNYSASYSIVEHLMQLGHRRIGLVIGPYHRLERLRQRLEGYRDCLESYGVSFDDSLVLDRNHAMLSGAEAMRHILAMDDRPTAVFAASDVLAFGALSELKRAGLRVPRDMSVAGFDDIEFAAFADPPLTTVRVPAREMGVQAVRVLLDMRDRGNEAVVHYCFDTDVIQRKSTGPVAPTQ